MTILTYITAFVIALLFIVLAPLFGAVALVSLFFGARQYPARVAKALDKVVAAGFGYEGDKTLSKECGLAVKRAGGCKACALLCRLLCFALHYTLERLHCEKEAS